VGVLEVLRVVARLTFLVGERVVVRAFLWFEVSDLENIVASLANHFFLANFPHHHF
jgi:hypothetical protein